MSRGPEADREAARFERLTRDVAALIDTHELGTLMSKTAEGWQKMRLECIYRRGPDGKVAFIASVMLFDGLLSNPPEDHPMRAALRQILGIWDSLDHQPRTDSPEEAIAQAMPQIERMNAAMEAARQYI